MKKILMGIGFIVLCVLIFVIARATKPDPEPVIVEKEIPVLDSVLKDSLTDEIHNKALRILGLEQAYNALFAKWKEVRPETIFVHPEPQKFKLQHEWIAKVVKTAQYCSVYTFRIDSLVTRDSAPVLDSVVGTQKLYPLKTKANEFVITSKPDGLFFKEKKHFSVSVMIGLDVKYTVMSDTVGFEDFNNMDRYQVGAAAEVWYKDRARLRTDIYTNRIWSVDLWVPIIKWGKIRR